MLGKIYLNNFRNFDQKLLEFSTSTTVIIGPNASGKTNILESIYLISTGKSFKARLEEEMINYDAEHARLKAKLDSTKLEVVLTRGSITFGTNKIKPAPKKRLLVDGAAKRLIDFAGHLKVVLFSPTDLDLIIASPSIRRNFLDQVLSQTDREYYRCSLAYEKGLRRRNKLLWSIRERNTNRNYLTFWDKLIIKNGNFITDKRDELLDFINRTPEFNGSHFSVEYDRSTVSESRLDQYKHEEIAAATTLVGPHRDDFIVKLKKGKARELDKYGSRGEQRMGVLWLKLAELEYIKKETEENPTLLLDDIFSELDLTHRKLVYDLCNNQQTIITTADPHFVNDIAQVEIIKIK
jgi:DNA replication and repair protein RecF